MPLASENVYNDLNGSDCKEILLTRFADLLNQVKEFAPHLTLPRVHMTVNLHLEIFGRTPPSLDINDDFIVRMRDVPSPLPDDIDKVIELSADINSDTTQPTGQPPDQIREEHGVPVMTPVKGPFGIEDKPVVREDRIKYAFNVTQDYGPWRNRTGTETPVIGADIIAQKNGGGGSADIVVGQGQNRYDKLFEQVKDPNYRDRYDGMDVNGQK